MFGYIIFSVSAVVAACVLAAWLVDRRSRSTVARAISEPPHRFFRARASAESPGGTGGKHHRGATGAPPPHSWGEGGHGAPVAIRRRSKSPGLERATGRSRGELAAAPSPASTPAPPGETAEAAQASGPPAEVLLPPAPRWGPAEPRAARNSRVAVLRQTRRRLFRLYPTPRGEKKGWASSLLRCRSRAAMATEAGLTRLTRKLRRANTGRN